jgi:Cu(I)/Ag(I) efflux system membrane fusion protein
MKRLRSLIIVCAVILASFLAGSWLGRRHAVNAGSGETQAVRPGGETGIDESSLPPGAISVMPREQQLIGLRVGAVEKQAVSHTLRLFARVKADEVRVFRLNASVDGWIQQAYANSVGSLVKKGDVLATFYSTQFLDAEQAFIYALDAVERLKTGKRLELSRQDLPVQTALDQLSVLRQVDNLRNLGMDDSQIEEIGRTRQITQNVRIISPASGFITARNVSAGQRFNKGEELFQIADLSRVWVLADVFEHDARYLKPGLKAAVRLPYQKLAFQAVVSEVLPIFDAETRTLKVRLVADNPSYILKPDMFADVELPVALAPAVTLPAEAILYSGLRKTVFVEKGSGVFEPRQVETGWRLGDRVEIVGGLEPGERVVLSGNFFLDSESRLRSAAQGLYGEVERDPVCGMDVDEGKAKALGLMSVHGDKTHYFCSKECKDQFDREPQRYVGKLPDRQESAGPTRRPDVRND